ncbi:oxidoreductase [Branchiostoma belcheri]|nr:oxidoreductase [Branchiostoma belcheri]
MFRISIFGNKAYAPLPNPSGCATSHPPQPDSARPVTEENSGAPPLSLPLAHPQRSQAKMRSVYAVIDEDGALKYQIEENVSGMYFDATPLRVLHLRPGWDGVGQAGTAS